MVSSASPGMTPSLQPPPPPARSMSTQSDAPPTADHSSSNTLLPPGRLAKDGRAASAAAPMRGNSYMTVGPGPGSFSSELKSTVSRVDLSRPTLAEHASFADDSARTASEQRQAELRDKIEKETKIKIGSENLLEALNSKNAKQAKDQKIRVEAELNMSNRKLANLKLDLETEIQRSREPVREGRLSELFRTAPLPAEPRQTVPTIRDEEVDPDAESPTFVLAELLQALEAEGMQPDYYVERGNALVELFKRHPTLKYDLAWSIFGLRVQTMLLSDSREVVAAGYRVLRYSITDRKSLQTIRSLNTDYLVILSLIKESKASVEREQALKFVRGFLEVKDGVKEVARAVIRIIVAMAEHSDDRLRNICLLTLAEILVKDPGRLVAAGGMGPLTDALGEGLYQASESLTASFLYLLDVPSRRKFLRAGHELQMPFAAFTDASSGHANEERLRANARVIAALMKSWTGLVTLCMHDFMAIKSLMTSLYIPQPSVRNVILELLFDVLRIKPPSWSSSFLAGRRLTTYGRVTNLKSEGATSSAAKVEEEEMKRSLVDHYVAVMLAVLLHSGLVPALLHAEEEALNLTLKRKTTLLLGEVLKMANELLPPAWSQELQVLPDLLKSAAKFGIDERFIATGTIYQVDSVNRTLFRSAANGSKFGMPADHEDAPQPPTPSKAQFSAQIDEAQFRNLMTDSRVLETPNYQKWRWDIVQGILDGPLYNPKRLDEALRATKFIHRLINFFRPFKNRFSILKNTRPNQRYVRAGCSLMRALLNNADGTKYLMDSKPIRQLGECLSHFDRMSGLTSEEPIFSAVRMSETLVGGYFAMLGELSKSPEGVKIFERWKMTNMFYHIIERHDRDDLMKALLSNMDYTLDGHLRIILSKAMTASMKEIRIFAARLLRKYATKPLQPLDSHLPGTGVAEWAIRLLVTQLYDPEIEVCEVAIKILEEACNQKRSLEYVVKCAPTMDHLGEIGAPLLLRFLSTSVGYHYLDGLDYITREMDDWFLGRNDSYVALVEASLARALADIPEKTPSHLAFDDIPEPQNYGLVPPHFYRELARTMEGCRLLAQKGHFDEFANAIKEHGMETEDAEIILKVKGCLWAVGNVGSMDLGAPFLESTDVTRYIVHIAEESEVMSLRGTAFFVLGLISRSLHGQEILIECGWDATVNIMGVSLGFCIPANFKKLFSIKPWVAIHVTHTPHKPGTAQPHITDPDPLNARILKLVTDLGNTVLAKRAANDLHSIKIKRAPGFSQPRLFQKVMAILESHHFRLPVCRFVIDLFEKGVLRAIVLEEESSSSESEGGGAPGDISSDSDSDSDSLGGGRAAVAARGPRDGGGGGAAAEGSSGEEGDGGVGVGLGLGLPPPYGGRGGPPGASSIRGVRSSGDGT
ncbi:Rapamycin-insensitive companion of mTOR, N-term-domain-containing protein [Phyllosticta citriasiana]|uniref:Rapamycin-insensitive companion of mTOR, N-term-domain-containing protein n=1 Tax=Phyllosticta citriasiana TaxID=595635 RepID=A0ABR1L236_9PEZI